MAQFGADFPRLLVTPLKFHGITRVDVLPSTTNLQGLQGSIPTNYTGATNGMDGVHLSRGPKADEVDEAGSFIYVPSGGQALDLSGSYWNMPISDTCESDAQCPTGTGSTCSGGVCTGVQGAIMLYVSSVEVDSHQNLSKYPSNADVYLYTVYYREPATGRWASLCPTDPYSGKATAMAVPMDPTADWSTDQSRTNFTFACTASGVTAKCARNWGYKPWKKVTEKIWTGAGFVEKEIPLAPLYDACLIAARADYCQDGASYTKDGTLVDLFDTLDGITSINPTSGLPYAPYASGPMMHEEYQISALDLGTLGGSKPGPHYVQENYCNAELVCSPEYVDFPEATKTLVKHLRRSGMQSSRYADRDPGRSCAAAPFTDRCDPREPYACYRAANMASHSYGAFLAVNSPRHCSHDEEHEGEALDPLCNECVNRVCQVDATCCGDPGNTYYPGSLVWDDHCTTIRNKVCRSVPTDKAPDDPAYLVGVWPPGSFAEPAGRKPVVFLRGAVGSFEGLVCENGTGPNCENGTWAAEGWSCDPDHPDASNPVQISVGGPLGAAGACLHTITAEDTLATSWRKDVYDECGGGARHGYHFALPACPTATNGDVYVYGIDVDLPGAPFSLLRGGKKTIPSSSVAATSPRAAIWTGWIEPSEPGSYTFCKHLPGGSASACTPTGAINPDGADWFRVWVNGRYVAGNWIAENSSVPGAFTLYPPQSPPAQELLKGVRYGVRVEYLRPATLPAASEFRLLWSLNGGTAKDVPELALYPMAQPIGNGLRGTYFKGRLPNDVGNPSDPVDTQTYGAVDFLWTGKNPPVKPRLPDVAGLTVNEDFAARFEGQVVPPVTGDYTFTADTDGKVTITIDGEPVTDGTRAAPSLDRATCPHDICDAGAAVSRTCQQGYFCASQVCQTDPYCCSVSWDATCVKKVADVCRLDCDPTPPRPVTLQAGTKYRIVVDYEHLGGTDDEPVRGATLRLMWSLAGSLRDAVPVQRLFAAGTPAGAGVGLNAAYFSDDAFLAEYLDRVEPTLDFKGSVAPGAARASLVCTLAACGSDAPPGAPALAAARMVADAGNSKVSVEVTGRGAATGATLEIWEATLQSNELVATSLIEAVSAGTPVGGTFTWTHALSKGSHQLLARQVLGGQTSAWSKPLAFEVFDPAAPPAPTLNAPSGGFVSGNGKVNVGGTAAPNATVTVMVGTTPTTFIADGNGSWGGVVTLPGSGLFALSLSQTVGTSTSAAVPGGTVKVALPALSLTYPPEGATISGPLSVSGAGADPNLGDVQVSDGDGRYFARRATVSVNPDGTFSGGAITLDPGAHQIKVFQSTGGLDGEGVVRTVTVKPPAVVITSVITGGVDPSVPPSEILWPEGKTVNANLTVKGTGLARTGLPGVAVIHLVTPLGDRLELGEGPLDENGRFSIPVKIAGAGTQILHVTQLASSLSGGGAAESVPTSLSVVVRPPAPSITTPITGTTHEELTVSVGGAAVVGAFVWLIIDNDEKQPALSVTSPGADAINNGLFGNDVVLTPGTHHLRAVQSVEGARGPVSADVLIAVGDTTPPTVSVTEASCQANCPAVRTKTAVAASAEGVALDFGTNLGLRIGATDSGAALPACAPGQTGTPSCFACSPASGSTFLLGRTTVTCSATDADGNHGRTKFDVVVEGTTAPRIAGLNMEAEALGPQGAAVAYQVTATGFLADCSPPGSGELVPCTTWKPAYAGLGFTPSALALDPNDPAVASDGQLHGALYALVPDSVPPVGPSTGRNHALKSTDGGSTWEELARPGGDGELRQLVVGAGSPPALYVPSSDGATGGIRISRDGGHSWIAALVGQGIHRIAKDPANPAHMVAWSWGEGATTMFETRDAWATWNGAVTQGLPGQQVLALAIDPLNPDRLYASVQADENELQKTKLYRSVGGARWERLAVPAYDCDPSGSPCGRAVRLISIAPALQPLDTEPDSPLQKYPTVFAGPLRSLDGGRTWEEHEQGNLSAIAFDRQNPRIVFGVGTNSFSMSEDGGLAWGDPVNLSSVPSAFDLVQDRAEPQTFYSAVFGRGLFKSKNGGATWTPVLAPGLSLPEMSLKNLAFDPVDPSVAYLLSTQGGTFKTTNGGDSWVARNVGVEDPYAGDVVSRIAVDRFNRNLVYFGGAGGAWKSLDAGEEWTQITDKQFVGIDPYSPDTVYANLYSNNDNEASYDRITNDDTLRFNFDGFLYYQESIDLVDFHPVPDARGTIAISVGPRPDDSGSWFGSDSGTHFFSPRILQTYWGRSYVYVDSGRVDTSKVFLDSSDGTNRIFVDGTGFGGDQGVLHRAFVDDVRADNGFPWTPLNELGPEGAFTDFSRLLIDPATGGQVMYTVGNSEKPGLWQSRDGGKTWSLDASTPPYLTNAWLSPVDGAVYATIHNQWTGAPTRQAWPGVLWKRTLVTKVADLAPGSRVVEGDLRVTCTGADGLRAAGAGAVFPLGETTLTCTAKDVFGNQAQKTLIVKVGDRTPPSVTVNVPVPRLGSAPAGGKATITFDVTATDLVDGPLTPTCTPASGSEFAIGTTQVTCTASDHATPPNVGRASFSVIVTQQGTQALIPTITTPDEQVVEAAGPDSVGTVVDLEVSATTSSGATLTPVCVPASGSVFRLGTTNVTCSATQGTVTVSRSFRVVVKDTVGPVLTVPDDFHRDAEGPWGRQDVPFTVTATDAVDGSVTPSCVPGVGTPPQLTATFALGTNLVTCRATDKAGNRRTETFHVIIDGLPPKLSVADVTAEAEDQLGARVTFDPAPSATDTAGNTVMVDCIPPSGTWFPRGDTEVPCSAVDLNGRESRASFVVHVVDKTAPAVVVPSSFSVEATSGAGATAPFQVTATDAVDGACTPTKACAPACRRVSNAGVPLAVTSPALFPVGDNLVSCSSTDAAGNVSPASVFTVTVRDTRAPALTLPPDLTADADATGIAVVTFTPAPSASDTVGGQLLVGCEPSTGSQFLPGTTTVRCAARDAAGNEATGTFQVVVRNGAGPKTCTSAAECGSGFCVDGVCCASACGGGNTNDCQACSIAAGGTADGTCTPLAATHVCRPSAGSCDVAETCDGTSLACPANGFAAPTTTCRASAGACDVAETCSGSSAACPADGFAPASTTCRPSAGACDVPESCSGSSAACPADGFAPPTTTCRPSAGACDVADTCSGTAAACPADRLAPAGQTCRAKADLCDVAEVCSGASATCPADGFVAAGTVCRPAGNVCELPGLCSGAGAVCPGVTPKPGCSTDTKPPVFSKVPGPITAYATSTAGAKVTYTKPTATDAVDGARTVTCDRASGSTFPVGKTTVTCSASDKSNNVATATFTVWVQYEAPCDGSFFLKPIRSNGSSIFVIGRPVPVRFKLTGASAGITNVNAKLVVTKLSSTIQGTATDVSDETIDDTDLTFRFNSLLKFYVYRWKTRDQTQGTYQLSVNLGDGVAHTIKVSLRKP